MGRTMVPEGLVGVYEWRERGGARGAAGFAPCGHTLVYPDPDGGPDVTVRFEPAFYAQRTADKTTVSCWSWDVDSLVAALGRYGVTVPPEAVAALEQDALTYTCDE